MRVLVACECSGVVREAFRALGHEAWSCDLLPADDGSPYHLQMDINMVLNYPYRVLGGMPRWMLERQWDLLIAHPPCDYLTVSGNRWFSDSAVAAEGVLTGQARREARTKALEFFCMLLNSPIPRICIENPIGTVSSRVWRGKSGSVDSLSWDRWEVCEEGCTPLMEFPNSMEPCKPTQIIQPWMFGEPYFKATCLWLKGLPKLTPTNILDCPDKGVKAHAEWSMIHRASPGPDRWKLRSKTFQGIANAFAAQWG